MKGIIGVDFGSCNLTIYKKGEGIVFKQPSLLSIEKTGDKYTAIAFGNDAKDIMLNNNNENIVTFSPLHEGEVKSVEYAGFLLKLVLTKLFPKSSVAHYTCKIAVPNGLDSEQTEKYLNVCKLAGFKKIQLIPIPLLIYYSNLDNKNINNIETLTVDIGGSKCDFGAISNEKIVKGATIALGGKAIDKSISIILQENFNIIITDQTAEKIKIEIGSLFANDNKKLEVIGLDVPSKNLVKKIVTSKDIYPCLDIFFSEICMVIKSILAESIASGFCNEDIYTKTIICGGLCNFSGIQKFISKKTGLKNCIILDNFENSVALGFNNIV